ncbi:SDR family oxidoreductase [Alteromonas gilva]|uniref:SDR family oxidoreductase n=1 Tax=Alteromonas gilva TaxID=2987522 RepID=A0ABT5KXC1_9ALTE|nr:SDR family oxidoreductase [Alteromonas gilva]MDC8829288.1 SDR family oxidoreductase [Alteromonas gilva]
MTHKVAIVTGSSRGIGAAAARQLAQCGYAIVLNYQHSATQAGQLQREITALGVPCIAVQADVSKEQEVAELFARADTLGSLAVLVNNAGILKQQSSLSDISVERFQHVMQVNVLSCFLCTKEAIKRMSTTLGGTGGAIVNVSSTAAKSGAPHEYVDYAASKGAMDTLTRGAAMELADQGIRVNAVRPALIYTDMHASGGEPGRVDRMQERIPLKRGGTVKEVAEAIVWLATDKSSFVTGTFIDASGGL